MKESTNKGFTLVELVTAIAILSFLLIGLAMFMSTGSRLYAMVYYKQEMLTESQLLMAQINDRVMDCNAGIAWDEDGDTLYVVQKSDTTTGSGTSATTEVTYQIHQYTLKGTDVLYKTKTWTANGLKTLLASGSGSGSGSDVIAGEFNGISDDYAKLAEYVEAFDVAMVTSSSSGSSGSSGSTVIKSVSVTTGFARSGESYEGSQLIHMRNEPVISSGTSTSIDALVAELLTNDTVEETEGVTTA